LFQTIPLSKERSEFPWFFPRWCESSHHHQGRQLGVQLQSSFQFHLIQDSKNLWITNTDNNKQMAAMAPRYLKNERADSDVKKLILATWVSRDSICWSIIISPLPYRTVRCLPNPSQKARFLFSLKNAHVKEFHKKFKTTISPHHIHNIANRFVN
jgi:hypothetical protein